MARHLLVDLENIQPAASAVDDWMGAEGKAWIFYGPHQHKLLAAFKVLGDRVTLIPISRPGANSLDFHLVFYLGYLAAGNPKSDFTVLAKDTGYDPAITHARLLTFAVKRVVALGSVTPTSAVVSSVKTKTQKQPAMMIKSPVASKKVAAKELPIEKSAVPAKKKTSAGRLLHTKRAPMAAPPAASTLAHPTGAASSRTVATTPPRAAPRASPPEQALIAKPSVTKKSAVKPAISIYRDVLAELREPNRPRSLTALERRIQSKLESAADLRKVQVVIDHLKTVDC